jgi:hypothetical protein
MQILSAFLFVFHLEKYISKQIIIENQYFFKKAAFHRKGVFSSITQPRLFHINQNIGQIRIVNTFAVFAVNRYHNRQSYIPTIDLNDQIQREAERIKIHAIFIRYI